MERSSGILMPISSLPSPYGIGTFGIEAYKFADFLKSAGQKYWQILPLGPTSYGDSPYQSFSSFAGNPYFIDLDMLVEDKLLTKRELKKVAEIEDSRHVDYGKIYTTRYPLLEKAKKRGYERDADKVSVFVNENSRWLPDFALYMACKRHFDMKSWTEWPDDDIRTRKPEALAKYKELLKDDIEFFIYIQYLFFNQWNKLREYIHSLGIKIIGDIPIYVALDSADVWSEPEWFQMDDTLTPTDVAGVPPDYFSEDGQLWGNPLYRWDKMKDDGYGWWIRRVDGAGKMFDVIRLDHFRGLDEYWAVPYGEATARNGQWKKGPGFHMVNAIKGWFHNLEFIAEDLGYPTPTVAQLLKDSQWPGMKVLEFAFDSRDSSNHAPHCYTENCTCYTGTHDNSPIMLWKDEVDPDDLKQAYKYLGINDKEGLVWGMVRGGASSVAKLFVAQMQDYLELGKGNRMNEPGIPSGNWQWRMLSGEATDELADKIYEMMVMYGRADARPKSVDDETSTSREDE